MSSTDGAVDGSVNGAPFRMPRLVTIVVGNTALVVTDEFVAKVLNGEYVLEERVVKASEAPIKTVHARHR
jgi:hypothetical protein